MSRTNTIAAGLVASLFSIPLFAQVKVSLHINHAKTYQVIDNFGASDAWACQIVGSWPGSKRNQIADWLFSRDTLKNGSPKGIGLSLWRYNLGAGSAAQGDSGGIKDEWRRAARTISPDLSEKRKVEAQNWFMMAAKKRGVRQFLAFYNSPPVSLTKNGRAFATGGISNIDSSNYKAFADYTVKAIRAIKKSTGISFDYVSPVNEPQWDWSDNGQEGCPYSNAQISALVKTFSRKFIDEKIAAKLVVSESGHLKYMLTATDKTDRDAQVYDFFNALSPLYLGDVAGVAKVISSHSYFSTSPFTSGAQLRSSIRDSINATGNLAYWQSEYCILGDNNGEIEGNKRDTGMAAALYVAKVIHQDLVFGNATAWQWWTAISGYDYKDGLVYVDKGNPNGVVTDSKMMWAMGNFSRFIQPGMVRIEASTDLSDLLVSAFMDESQKTLVLVFINGSMKDHAVSTDAGNLSSAKTAAMYTTSASQKLSKRIVEINQLVIPAKSIVTLVLEVK